MLRNLRGEVSRDVLLLAYYSLFQSLFSYGILVWGHSVHADEVFAIQRKAVRVMTGRQYRDEVRDAFISLGILTVPSMYIYVTLCYFKRNIANYSTHSDIHNHNTRFRNSYKSMYLRLSHSHDAVGYYGTHFYNRLPTCIRSLPDNTFRHQVKQLLIKNAFYSIPEYLNGHHS